MIARCIAALAVALAFAVPSGAQEPDASQLQISNAWSRVAPPGAPVLGGYLSITNGGGEPDRLLAVSSSFSDDVQMHVSSIKDGVASMRQVTDGVPIPVGETIKFEPGGLHLMLLDPKSRPAEGGKIPLTLKFEKAGQIDVELVVSRSPPKAVNEHEGHVE